MMLKVLIFSKIFILLNFTNIFDKAFLKIFISKALLYFTLLENFYYYKSLFHETNWWALVVKNPPSNAGDIRHMGSIPGLGRSHGEGSGNPLQYSCMEDPWTEEPGKL